jgi:hypothetical protein
MDFWARYIDEVELVNSVTGEVCFRGTFSEAEQWLDLQDLRSCYSDRSLVQNLLHMLRWMFGLS